MAVNIMVLPLSPIPSQQVTVLLQNQLCTINIRTFSTGLFFDLFVNDEPVVTGVICRDRIALVRLGYFGFVGDFFFKDLQGLDDPVYTGFAPDDTARFVFCYLPLPEAGS